MEFEDKLSMVLTIGILLSAFLMLFGLAFIIAAHGANGYTISSLIKPNSIVDTRSLTLGEVFTHPSGITAIYLGIMVLVSLPVLTVAFLLARYVSRRDKLFIIISAVVLFDLLFAILVIPYFLH